MKLEKDEIAQRLRAVKEAAKHGLESSSRSLDGVRSSLDTLKAQSEDSFAFAALAKSSLADVEELRATVTETMKAPLLNDEGRLYKSQETKAVIADLQLDCTKSQQVADILRDRLQCVGAQLLDAKSRVSELEVVQMSDRETFRATSNSLTSASLQVSNLAQCLKDHQAELNDALANGADLEAKLIASEERISQIREILSGKEAELEALTDVNKENTHLQTTLNERDMRIQELESLQPKLDAVDILCNKRGAQISALERSISIKDEIITDLTNRITQREAKIEKDQAKLQTLMQASGASEAREQALQKAVFQSEDRLKELKNRQDITGTLLEEARKEIELRIERLHEANTKYQVIEDRFEDQSVTLRLTKESNGDLQERLIESEAKFARDLEATRGKQHCELALLNEQKLSLQAKINDLEETMRLQRETVIADKAHEDDKLSKLMENHSMQLGLEQGRVHDMQKVLEDTRTVLKTLEDQFASGKAEMSILREELKAARLPSPAHQEAVDALGAQISALRLENTALVLRTRSIDTRYRVGDLNDEEKVFINTLVQTSQAIHEQELVAKGNELRRVCDPLSSNFAFAAHFLFFKARQYHQGVTCQDSFTRDNFSKASQNTKQDKCHHRSRDSVPH
ncbi:hypothetical protein EW026_g6184 [Hermanssonia centrifuga]|uniref:Uncharacterized protein n=1 Tax=Hermanssonia centrifuga TaxID=98765 RepID=A0A4S4KBT2_9APHY|nr:hypothetical protein EW026_g6184 [Hermanssonia centrifuga]